jgi:hypothetical protein
MPQAPTNTIGTIRNVGTYSSGDGYLLTKGLTTVAKSNSPNPSNSPPVLIGTDSANINLVANPTNLLSFPNIVNRQVFLNVQNNLKSKNLIMTIPMGGTLVFSVSGGGGLAVPVVTMQTKTLGTIGLDRIITSAVAGSLTLGPGTYKMFRAQVPLTVTTGAVYASLYYQA